ncbi:GAF domain-containing protein, partial [candidate division KSB3 bacterium]|nr:GAF domain-containing protein [candidate division KSB3 bacterium]
PYSATVRGWRLAPGQGIAGTVARTGNSLIVSDVLGDERHFKGVDQETGQVLRSILCVAMKVKQHVIGVLQVLDTEPNRFDETDRVLQELLATTAAIAIQNAQLNERLQQHAKTRSLLIYEINHRVTNTLDTITDLFSFAQRHAKLKKYPVYLEMMMDLFHRVKILATSYSLLAEFEWNPLPLSELSSRVIHASLNILGTSKQITVEVHQSPIQIPPQQVNTLALILRELVANTVEHGLADRESGRITVHIARMGETVHLEFRDDGPGYSEDVLRFDQHNVGLYLIQKIVHRDLQGEIALPRDGGAVTVIRFKLADDSPAA